MKPPSPMNRRVALTAFGTVGLSTIIAACSGSSSDSSDSADTSVSSPPTTAQASSTADGDLSSLFDDAASCTLSPEQTEGPYYIDVDMIRDDIRDDREGARLRLATRVLNASSCDPIANAVVDVWHCDATGVYSGFESGEGETFLRGSQVTNADGIAEFTTIYPGWYRGRTVHIHTKVHLDNSTLLTSQLYFDDDVTDGVYNREPYSSRSTPDTTNADDSIFEDQMVMTVTEDGDGYLAVMNINVDV